MSLDTDHDLPIIRTAILNKLDKERGVRVVDMPMKNHGDFLAVGVLALLDDTLLVRSVFHLPPQFDLRHVHNELDQIAEQYKATRLDFWGRGRTLGGRPEVQLRGTGLRGLWPA